MIRFIALSTLLLSLLTACSSEQESGEAISTLTAEINTSSESSAVSVTRTNTAENFDTSIPVRTLMNAIVQPSALQLWQAVRYVVTLEGVEEDISPQTNEDWEKLRTSAMALIETSNALMLPGRLMDDPDPDEDYPDYMYRSEEIQALVDSDPEIWNGYIQQMQFFTKATLETIEKRDVLGLIETGAVINNACEGCHAEFWYRRNN